MTIGEKIKFARTLRNLTQKELGFLVGLSDDRIRKYELDTRTPKESILEKFSTALGVPLEYFTSYPTDNTRLLHLLFELESTHGLDIEKSNDDVGYTLKFNDPDFNEYLRHWYERKKEKLQALEMGSDNPEKINTDYLDWKIRYPLSYADECMKRLSEKRNKR